MRALTIEDVQQWAIDKGGEFLSKQFFGRDNEHTWRCDKGHVFDLRSRFVQRGAWGTQSTVHDKKIASLELMQEWAEKHEGKCISEYYVNSWTPLEWECKNGHRFKKSRDHIKQKSWCYECEKNEFKKNKLEEKKKIAISRHGKCLSAIYFDPDTKLEFACKHGHR